MSRCRAMARPAPIPRGSTDGPGRRSTASARGPGSDTPRRIIPWLGGLRAVLLAGLTLGPLTACTAQASGHIRVVRSFFLERGHLIEPRALTRTHDGGYVIAGRLTGPWATRINDQGQVVWRYLAPLVPLKPGEIRGDTMFTGAVTLPDDSTLLCGYENPTEVPNAPLTGLLTHLSPHGRVLSTQTLYPNNDRHYVLNYLDRCVRWGKGVAVVGSTTLFPKGGTKPFGEVYLWLLKLDAHGHIAWEKLIPNVGGNVEVLKNHDLVLAAVGARWGNPPSQTEITELGPDGSVKRQRTILGGLALVHSGAPETSVSLVSRGSAQATWRTLGAHLQTVARAKGSTGGIAVKKAYRLPNGALALFGYTTPPEYGGMLLSSIAWISPHFSHQQVFTFKPWSIWVADAIPTGKPGEFATVREVSALHHPFDRHRMGIVLSIVHIQ